MSLPMLSQPNVEPGIPECLTDLCEVLDCKVHFDAEQAAEMLTELKVTAADLSPWYNFDHAVTDSYGRVLVKRGANHELMVMSWAPGDYSAIHDHGLAEWGAVRYFGAADHIVFTEHNNVLSVAQRMRMRLDDVHPIEPSLIHLMGNPTKSPLVSLHLYGRSQAADTITGSARIFDLHENKVQRTDGGVFFCLPEEDIKEREPCPRADARAQLLHHKLMLARIERILKTEGFNRIKAATAEKLGREIKHLYCQKFPSA